MPTYTPVQLGTLVPGAQPLGPDEKGVNESFRGFVDLAGERVNAYIKVLNKRELVNEALISTVGRALDLRIPEFYFVQALAQDLPNSELLRNHSGTAIIGATRGLPHPDLSRRFQGDEKAFNLWLGDWGELDSAISFDEWVARRPLGTIYSTNPYVAAAFPANLSAWLRGIRIGGFFHLNVYMASTRAKNSC